MEATPYSISRMSSLSSVGAAYRLLRRDLAVCDARGIDDERARIAYVRHIGEHVGAIENPRDLLTAAIHFEFVVECTTTSAPSSIGRNR